MADFTMPALGADMETGTVVEWKVRPGDHVRSGDVIAVVETHKGAIDVECFLDGTIDDLVPLGQELPVDAVLASVRGPESAAAPAAPAPTTSVPPAALPSHLPVAEAPTAPMHPPTSHRRKVSPAARHHTQALGIDPDTLSGTGVEGAVTLADVARSAHAAPTAAPAGPSITPANTPTRPRGGFDPDQMRRAIAAAMGRSKREIPHYYLRSTISFAAAQSWLSAWNRTREPAERLLPAVLLLKAAAKALAQFPQFNGLYVDGQFQPAPPVHLGWAIALRGGGLVAPAIHHAQNLPLPALMDALRDLVQRARAGGLRSSELSDPTVTVTSLGDRGADEVLGVIYPPQVAILGFGRIVERPWVVQGQVLPQAVVSVSLAADHRVSDGHLGGQLLAAIDSALQSPDTL
ncbi:MAG TPA: dihydrolipoamide acetyltransferase family protein [Acidovorax sp.]|nr:dihydrolipoamide acetyltransferase family protein [Acidovorax sp.]